MVREYDNALKSAKSGIKAIDEVKSAEIEVLK